MEKKNRKAAGVVFLCVLFTVSLVTTAIGWIFFLSHIDEYKEWGFDNNKYTEDYEQYNISRLADEIASDALFQYDSRVFDEGNEFTMPEYDEYRSNFSFTIEPVDDKENLPTYTNYICDDYSYSMEKTTCRNNP